MFFCSSSIFPVPPPRPPATAASAWEITDTESAASSSVLLTGDFLPLRALGWDQTPPGACGLGIGGTEGQGWRTSGERGRGGKEETWKKKTLEKWKNSEGCGERGRGLGGGKEDEEGEREWRLGGGEPGGQPASPGSTSVLPAPSAHPGRLLGGPGSRGPGCRVQAGACARGLRLCLAPPSLPLTWWFALHLVCGAAGPALGV